MNNARQRRIQEGTPLTDADYIAVHLKNASLEELLLFAASVCRRVVDSRITGGYSGEVVKTSVHRISTPLLARALQKLDEAVHSKRQSQSAHPGNPRLKHSWEAVKMCHGKHRNEYAKRAAFVRFAISKMMLSDRPSTRTVDAWVVEMDKQQVAG
jgi:hypothetical protein